MIARSPRTLAFDSEFRIFKCFVAEDCIRSIQRVYGGREVKKYGECTRDFGIVARGSRPMFWNLLVGVVILRPTFSFMKTQKSDPKP